MGAPFRSVDGTLAFTLLGMLDVDISDCRIHAPTQPSHRLDGVRSTRAHPLVEASMYAPRIYHATSSLPREKELQWNCPAPPRFTPNLKSRSLVPLSLLSTFNLSALSLSLSIRLCPCSLPRIVLPPSPWLTSRINNPSSPGHCQANTWTVVCCCVSWCA